MNKQKPKRRIIMWVLDRLDDAVINTPGREFSRLDKAIFSFIRGGTKRPQFKRTGNRFLDWLIRAKFYLSLLLDKLDTWALYNGRSVRTNSGVRVRSRSEKRIAELLDKRGITYRYEHPLILDGIELRPDFYLPREKVFIEFWGLADDDMNYVEKMNGKKWLYRKHGIKVISLYPRHMRNLEKNLARLYENVTGKKFPEPRRSLVHKH